MRCRSEQSILFLNNLFNDLSRQARRQAQLCKQ